MFIHSRRRTISAKIMILIVALCLIAAVVAAPPPNIKYSNDNVQLLKYANDASIDGSYDFGFEQSDGQSRQEQGQVVNPGQENEYVAVQGVYTWIGPDGVEYIVKYTADEDGYKPEIQQGPGGGVPAQLASLIG